MDKNYWETYYSKRINEELPSLFAKFVVEKINGENLKLIELGCGNGRDAIYFSSQNFTVFAIDQCSNEINFLNEKFKNNSDIQFVNEDFTKLSISEMFDIVYSRFTLHSILSKEEDDVLKWTFDHLNSDGHFCIEVRGQKNEIFQKGEPVENEENAFVLDGHFRRFINFETFCNKLKSIGFKIDYAEEQKGFAPFNGLDETFIRIIANK